MADNVDIEKRFYEDVFGWQYESYETGKDAYTLIRVDGRPIAPSAITRLNGRRMSETGPKYVWWPVDTLGPRCSSWNARICLPHGFPIFA